MPSSYHTHIRIAIGPHGAAIYGAVPVLLLRPLLVCFEQEYGWGHCDMRVSDALGCTVAVTTAEGGEAWLGELGARHAD